MKFSINGDQGEKITIDVLARSSPDSEYYYDLNFIDYHIEVIIPGYHVSFDAVMETFDIERFLNQLEEMNKTLSGTAELTMREDNIKLREEMGRTGNVTWKGETTYPAGIGNTLTFNLRLDQTFLPSLISELKDILKEIPIIRKPATKKWWDKFRFGGAVL